MLCYTVVAYLPTNLFTLSARLLINTVSCHARHSGSHKEIPQDNNKRQANKQTNKLTKERTDERTIERTKRMDEKNKYTNKQKNSERTNERTDEHKYDVWHPKGNGQWETPGQQADEKSKTQRIKPKQSK